MSDRRRIVTISPSTGTVTTLEDFDDNATLYAVRDSFTVKSPERNQIMAQKTRRYGGAQVAFETHGNGEIAWTCLVRGTTADNVITNVETALAVLEQPRTNRFFEWRPDGATNSVFYEIAGPARWNSDYKWVQFLGAQSMQVQITIPVKPLARRAVGNATIASQAFPATVQLSPTITGRAPAAADITITTAAGQPGAPVWALFAWTTRPASPLPGSVVPFGLIEAETSSSFPGWTVTTGSPDYRGGSGLTATTSGAGSSAAAFMVDPSTLQPDDFTDNEVVVEVWARYIVDAAVVNPRMSVSIEPQTATNRPQYTAEWGANGRPLVKPNGAGNATRISRLGTLTMPIDANPTTAYRMKVGGFWDAGSSGLFGLDYLFLVPAKQRCLLPTAKQYDAVAYPQFNEGTTGLTKTIKSDLSGLVGNQRSAGLGGSPIELPPGLVDLFIHFSNQVPDDPTPSAAATYLAHTASGNVQFTPRYFLASD